MGYISIDGKKVAETMTIKIKGNSNGIKGLMKDGWKTEGRKKGHDGQMYMDLKRALEP